MGWAWGQVHCHGRESGSHNGCAVLRAGASLRDRAGVPAGRGSAGPIAERNARIGRRALPLQAVPRDNGGLMSSPTSSKPSRPGADEAAAPSARPVLRRPEKPQAEPTGDARRPSGGAGRSAGARGPRNDRNDRNERGGRNERYERSDRRDAGPRGDARDAAPAATPVISARAAAVSAVPRTWTVPSRVATGVARAAAKTVPARAARSP